jgi:hypothetical protein
MAGDPVGVHRIRLIASSSDNGTVRLWDPLELRRPPGGVYPGSHSRRNGIWSVHNRQLSSGDCSLPPNTRHVVRIVMIDQATTSRCWAPY